MTSNSKTLKEKAARVKWLFADVDGTLTDGTTGYTSEGELFKRFSQTDGTGFYLLAKAGIRTGFITGEDSQIVMRRAEKLKIDKCFLGITDKKQTLEKFAAEEGISLGEIAYIGDDLIDLEMIISSGLSFAPANARESIKKNADIICNSAGGNGAFREAAELLLELRGYSITGLYLQK